MELWGWLAALALTAACAAAGGYFFGRGGGRSIAPAEDAPADTLSLLQELAQASIPIDLLPRDAAEGGAITATPLARCLPRIIGPGGLTCELLDSGSGEGLALGLPVTCCFAPRRVPGGSVNAFQSVLAALDPLAEPPLVVLTLPGEMLDAPRRRHPRKRVSDQRFLRLRLWLASPGQTPLYFPDAAPDIWINAYDADQGGGSSVTDISTGGVALDVRPGLAPAGLAKGSPVVLKCSLFHFKEKRFRPYWYAGAVRGLSPQADGGARIAIGFTHVGRIDPAAPQGVAWAQRPENDNQGG